MNRRQFFASFASVPIAASLVIPELTRTIFLPPAGGWQVNELSFARHTMDSIREDLIDAIYNIDPFKTPLFNLARRLPDGPIDVYPSVPAWLT